MAIDKVSDLTKTTNVIDESVEVAIQEREANDPTNVNVEMTEDGGAEIDFDPQAAQFQSGQDFDTNLVEFLDEDVLIEVASDLEDSYEDFKAGRSDWEDTYVKGLELLGFKYENRSTRIHFIEYSL